MIWRKQQGWSRMAGRDPEMCARRFLISDTHSSFACTCAQKEEWGNKLHSAPQPHTDLQTRQKRKGRWRTEDMQKGTSSKWNALRVRIISARACWRCTQKYIGNAPFDNAPISKIFSFDQKYCAKQTSATAPAKCPKADKATLGIKVHSSIVIHRHLKIFCAPALEAITLFLLESWWNCAHKTRAAFYTCTKCKLARLLKFWRGGGENSCVGRNGHCWKTTAIVES